MQDMSDTNVKINQRELSVFVREKWAKNFGTNEENRAVEVCEVRSAKCMKFRNLEPRGKLRQQRR